MLRMNSGQGTRLEGGLGARPQKPTVWARVHVVPWKCDHGFQ